LNKRLVFLPVVDVDGKVVGVLNRGDVSRALTGGGSEERR
jgi:CBS domain-containing protein